LNRSRANSARLRIGVTCPLRSEPCLGELDHASASNKRIIPVCIDQASAEMEKPAALGELRWALMRPGDDFDAGVARVVHALDTDLEVVRTHTRILVRARAWELTGRRTSPLLRGDELRQAERWLATAAASGSPPTELQQDFIVASRRASTRRLVGWRGGDAGRGGRDCVVDLRVGAAQP